MTDRNIDSPPPGPLGRSFRPGEVYIDTVTGEAKQVQLGAPDLVLSPGPQQETEPAVPAREGGIYGEYDAAKAELDSVTELLARANAARAEFGARGIGQAPATTVIFNEQTYDLPALEKEIARLKKNEQRAKKRFSAAEKVVKPLERKVENIKDQIDGAGDDAARRAKWEKQLPAAEKELAAAKAIPAGTKLSTEAVKTASKTGTPTSRPVAQPASAADFRRFEERMGVPTTTPPATQTPATTTGGTGGRTGGGTGRGAGGSRVGRRGRRGAAGAPGALQAEQWASIVQQEFGPLWDVYNSNPDVKAVLDKSVKEGWFNDETKLTESLRNTNWFRTTERSARNFAVRQSTDPAQVEDEIVTKIEDIRGSASANALMFDDATLRRLATDSIKFGWSEQQQLNALGSEAVAQARGRGAQGLADLRSGFTAQDLRKTAASYAQKVSDTLLDAWVADIMTGRKTQQQWTDLMRSNAATQFRSLQPALEKGQDVETAMFAYQQQAQRVLGDVMDVTNIDWTSDKWNKALNFRDEKTNEYRQMDLWEWNQYLRGMEEWKQTSEAKNLYGNIAMSLTQAFSTKTPQGMNQ